MERLTEARIFVWLALLVAGVMVLSFVNGIPPWVRGLGSSIWTLAMVWAASLRDG